MHTGRCNTVLLVTLRSSLHLGQKWIFLSDRSAPLPLVDPQDSKSGEDPQNEDRHGRVGDTHPEHVEDLIAAEHLFYQRDISQPEVHKRPKPLRNGIAHRRQPHVHKQDRQTDTDRTHLAFHAGGDKADDQTIERAGKNKPCGPGYSKLPDLPREHGPGIGGNGLDGGVPAVETPMRQKTEQERGGQIQRDHDRGGSEHAQQFCRDDLLPAVP